MSIRKTLHPQCALHVLGADLLRLGFREFGPMVRRSWRGPTTCASFGHHVSHVVDGIAEKQVIWANALRIVAMVANILVTGIFTVCKLPRKPVGAQQISATPSGPDDAITSVGLRASPQPTPISLGDLGPKPSIQTGNLMCFHAAILYRRNGVWGIS